MIPKNKKLQELYNQKINLIKELAKITNNIEKCLEKCKHKIIKQGDFDGAIAVCEECGKHFGWWCEESKEHLCKYDEEDIAHDNCIYCHKPEERK